MKTAAILLSRQPLRPHRLTPWIRQTMRAVDWIKENRLCLFTSFGMQTWEFLIYLAQKCQIEQMVLIPSANENEFKTLRKFISDQFNLDRSLARFLPVFPRPGACINQNPLYHRDYLAVFESDILIPVSIRAKGHMENLILKRTGKKNGRIMTCFQINYQKREHPIAYNILQEHLPMETKNIGDQYIIHWTRATNGPWPTEKKHAYFSDISMAECYPRNAFHTLQNIIQTGKIIASSTHMPRKTPTVSFSGLAPERIIPLMKWRSRYRRMSFEPYGIGIEKATAGQLAIVPVHYYRKGEYPENEEPWKLQSRGMKTDWKQEAEYRYPGDLHLSDIDRDRLACFCHTRDEAQAIEKRFGIRTYAFVR